jgi:hypothetical protein
MRAMQTTDCSKVLLFALIALSGCASTPPISQLSQGARKVALVQNGTVPLSYSTGVIDAASFWANYGGGLTGGPAVSALGNTMAAAGRSEETSKAAQNRDIAKTLVGDTDIAQVVSAALLPQLARAWGARYDQARVITLGDKLASVEPQTLHLQGLQIDADLVLMIEVANINVTQKFSLGSSLASGITFGAGKKALTTEVTVLMRAFKLDAAGAGYKQVWAQSCGPNYTTMKTAYYMDDLKQSPEKMIQILDEAKTQSIDRCGRMLAGLSKQS